MRKGVVRYKDLRLDPQLDVDVVAMRFDGLNGEVETDGDLLAASAESDESGDFVFPRGKLADGKRTRRAGVGT